MRDVPGFMSKLYEAAGRLCIPALVALLTGMRLGEVLALRWNRVDLDGKVIQVREALEQAYGIVPLQVPEVEGGAPRHRAA